MAHAPGERSRLERHAGPGAGALGGALRLAVQLELRAVGLFAAGRAPPLVRAVGLQPAALHVVGERGVEGGQHLRPALGRAHREEQLDPVVEVARHPVGAREVDLLVAAVREVEDARVLEEAVDDRDDVDVVARALEPRPEAADPAHVEANADAGPRRVVERADDVLVHERVHLGADEGALAGLGPLALAVDEPQHAVAQLRRRHHELLRARRVGVAGERVEEGRRVLADVRGPRS